MPDIISGEIPSESKIISQPNKTDNLKKLSDHSISFYLNHRQIPNVCKDLYTNKRSPSDDNDVLALLDSIFTNNNETRPFYFLTLTKTMEKADGAYAESIGIMAKNFVEKRSEEFIKYFANEPMLTKKDFEEWAISIAGEIQISFENSENEEIQKLKNTMINNCSSCNNQNKLLIDDFVNLIKNHCP